MTARTIGLAEDCAAASRRGLQHLAAAGGVDGQHADSQLGGRADGRGDGVGYVVEFEVEEDLAARSDQLADELRPFGGEELFADFVSGGRLADGLDDLAGLGGAGDVKRHDKPIFWKHRLTVYRIK